MGFTAKYEFEDLAYGVSDKSGIVTSNVGKMDDHLHTYGEGTAGETIAIYEAVYLESDGKYDLAQADGTQQPCAGLAIEAAALDATFRFQRIGPLTNTGWTWGTVGAKVYLDLSTPGELTDTKPTQYAQAIGTVLSATSIFIDIENRFGYLVETLVTAVNDFLIGEAAGKVVKKTLAEVKTLLGLDPEIVCYDNQVVCYNNNVVYMGV